MFGWNIILFLKVDDPWKNGRKLNADSHNGTSYRIEWMSLLRRH
jgi:hypothetical protein